ncbi:tRNA (adenine(22)-N(1))-methyltransferase [Clostridium sp. DL1XJH146]
MNLSKRLKAIARNINECEVVADIGTDHAYLPIYLIENKICNKAIAADINKGPVLRARNNIKSNKVEGKIECRLGSGLQVLEIGEVDVAVIAGMGGNLIRDIIEEEKDIFTDFKYAIVQPVQNPDVLRKYFYEKGFTIIDEDLCYDEGKYYEIIKVKYDNNPTKKKEINYIFSEKLIEKNHPLIKEYIIFKINSWKKILQYIKDDGQLANDKKDKLSKLIFEGEELLKCL